ncbi:quinone-dependent dihydroorotate dehydrogenase [Saliphagus sp. LR7]|uniref:quinone-dependent dihydroorotate dehydrogenase n=1 Tax=Saliphagus sp. LR7 TaxID=2282654 RepID=UPI000DF7CA93|nr:quinone-dependent dihydroorotate dehydrogenase [Saliphagus sp. LR7]
MTLYARLRPYAFRLPAEMAHEAGKGLLRVAGATRPSRAALERVYRYDHPALEIDLFDTTFPNPVGVAAGFDKDAEVTGGLAALGFGFVEVGTVTPEPQSGNRKPRLFRLAEDRALVNRMGFNGAGADAVAERLAAGRPEIPVGANVGRMNAAGEEEAIEDYRRVFARLSPYPDYFVVNVSCPNTPETFDESSPEHLERVFGTLQAENDADEPILVKIGPDATAEGIGELVEIAESHGIDGIVATNTASDREGFDLESTNRKEWGGLSGAPLEERSTRVVRTVASHTDLPVIGVGGVDSAESAYRKIRAGASLVELYTAFVYEGPTVAREINRGLVSLLHRDGFSSVEEAVGADL